MNRTVTIPSTTVTEAINDIQEIPSMVVRFLVGKVDQSGNFIIGQNFEVFTVIGDDYIELNGPPTTWAPDKPTGTYRNDDLWHYVDKQRLANSNKSS
jgi:hypothetical protein